MVGATLMSPAASGTFPGQNGRIAFVTGETIATMKSDGSHVHDLRSGFSPSWSAGGRRIVFMRAHGGMGSDLYVMRANGSRFRRLTSTPKWWDAGPAFSPNDRKIVFYRLFQGATHRAAQLVVVRLHDLSTRVVTTHATAPEWAPNGRRIVFAQDDGGIATIRPDGTHNAGSPSLRTTTPIRPTPPAGTRSTSSASRRTAPPS
jgi:tricorn protease-like protein